MKYFGVGNESGGCGGNLSAEAYAMEVRRYASFLQPFDDTPLHRVASGPMGDDPAWTRQFFAAMAGCGGNCPNRVNMIQAFAMHYYTGGPSGTVTTYDEGQWYELFRQALRIEPLIVQTRAIMDGFDPQRHVGLVVDEWGVWLPDDPGSANTPLFARFYPSHEGEMPRICYHQTTIRDALVSALHLDTFNRHADKVVMANMSFAVNVFKSLVFTDGPDMVATPTYHVFEMYAPHQGAEALPCHILTDEIAYAHEAGKGSVPRVTGSCSRKDGVVTLSLVNTHVAEPVRLDVDLLGMEEATLTRWRVLRADEIHARNTFERPDRVVPKDVGSLERIELPPASVNVLTFEVLE